jgi:hypothetical protein
MNCLVISVAGSLVSPEDLISHPQSYSSCRMHQTYQNWIDPLEREQFDHLLMEMIYRHVMEQVRIHDWEE